MSDPVKVLTHAWAVLASWGFTVLMVVSLCLGKYDIARFAIVVAILYDIKATITDTEQEESEC